MADSYIEVSKETFAEIISNADPSQILAVNFASGQSNICQIQEPEFIAISREYQDRITFAKVNVEEQGEFTQRWHVEGVPTLVFFKGGQEIHRINGVMMRAKLRRRIEGVLVANSPVVSNELK